MADCITIHRNMQYYTILREQFTMHGACCSADTDFIHNLFTRSNTLERAVESMHWLLEIHSGEDFCRMEDKAVQQNLNILRKFALSIIKIFKQRTSSNSSKRPLSHMLFDCLLTPDSLPALWSQN